MATSRKEGIQSIESLFPIIATDLRTLVSSWLPPARDPSPIDDEYPPNGEFNGRQERYAQFPSYQLCINELRLALGATLSKSQPSSQFQNRMNRKMGITLGNGHPKTGKTNTKGDDTANTASKRKAEVSSDSEEDSKLKLITKLSSKKSEFTEPTNKRKISSGVPKRHQAIQNGQTNASPSATSLERKKLQSPMLSVNEGQEREVSAVFSHSQSPSSSVRNGFTSKHTLATASAVKQLEIQTLPEYRATNSLQDDPTKEAKRQERKRLKREKKKEAKRLKKLEKHSNSK